MGCSSHFQPLTSHSTNKGRWYNVSIQRACPYRYSYQGYGKVKAFYIENLGFKLEHEARLEKPGNQWVNLSFLRLGSMLVELIEPSDKTKAGQGQGGSINHIAVEVKGIGDIVKTLKEKGIEMETEQPNSIPHLFNGVKTAFSKGPSGKE